MAFDLDRAHGHCGQNRAELERSTVCGCFECLAIYSPDAITLWCDEGDVTAICPECDIDTVIGDAAGFPITREFLEQMHERWMESIISTEELMERDWELAWELAGPLGKARMWLNAYLPWRS